MAASESVQTVVIGAGVVGLAIARALAATGREVVILEAADRIGSVTSSRNSEVIHAGIYYPTGSLKARLCVEGKHRLYRYAAERAIAHNRCGKLIVAVTDAEMDNFGDIAARAHANGVTDLTTIAAAEARAMEPELACVGALLSPSTGVIDSHGLMVALLGDAEAGGAVLALQTPVTGVASSTGGYRVETGGAAPVALEAREVVNAAGHGSVPLADGLLAPDQIPRAWFARGCYFKLSSRAPFSRLIYPAPVPGGLGTHLTLDLSGQARFGPDVEWIEAEDYALDPARGRSFYADIRRYWPGLPDGALHPDYTGIRPKITGPGTPAADFRIERSLPGLVNLWGIESPGLTACLAIGDRVQTLLDAP